jgi:organic radical activating enzyme
MTHLPTPTAALAGVPAGLQAQGVWLGRRQLFVRFAAEAETATMYTADALAGEIRRAVTRTSFHSVSISGRDPLSNVDYLCIAFERAAQALSGLPVMLDVDGQRPAELDALKTFAKLAQITIEGSATEAIVDRAFETVARAAKLGMQHALVVLADDRTTDASMLRFVERAHETSDATMVVIHPGTGIAVDKDRRWTTLFERASALHGDVRLMLRLPPPTGMR